MNDDWIGGFLDGEGSILAHITFYQGRRRTQSGRWFRIQPLIHIAQSERPILNEVQQYLGLGKVRRNWHRPDRLRDSYGLRIDGWKECKQFIDRIGSHSILKQKHIAVMQRMYELCADFRQGRKIDPSTALHLIDLAVELRKLNGRNPAKMLERLAEARRLALVEIGTWKATGGD
jgi:hypothetical protein